MLSAIVLFDVQNDVQADLIHHPKRAGAGAGVDDRFEMNSLGVLPVQDDRTALPRAASTASQRGTAPARGDVLACDCGNMGRRSP